MSGSKYPELTGLAAAALAAIRRDQAEKLKNEKDQKKGQEHD